MSSITDKLAELGIEPAVGAEFSPLSEAEAATIETTIGVPLPEGYKRLLLRFGGFVFSTEVNCTPSQSPLYVGWFFGFADLVESIENCKDFLPETIIPIGDDGGGNLFCLGVRGEDVGKVYFHNHGIGWQADAERCVERGEAVPPDIRYQVVHQVAPSFEDFIKNMATVEEDG